MLLNEAVRLGAKIQLDCEVQKVDFGNKPKLTLKTGQTVVADIVIGADGETCVFSLVCLITFPAHIS